MNATDVEAAPRRTSRTNIVLWCLATLVLLFYCPISRGIYHASRFRPSLIVGLTAQEVLDKRGHPDSVYLPEPMPAGQKYPSDRELEGRIIAGGDGDFVYHGWWWQSFIVRFEKGVAVKSFDAGK